VFSHTLWDETCLTSICCLLERHVKWSLLSVGILCARWACPGRGQQAGGCRDGTVLPHCWYHTCYSSFRTTHADRMGPCKSSQFHTNHSLMVKSMHFETVLSSHSQKACWTSVLLSRGLQRAAHSDQWREAMGILPLGWFPVWRNCAPHSLLTTRGADHNNKPGCSRRGTSRGLSSLITFLIPPTHFHMSSYESRDDVAEGACGHLLVEIDFKWLLEFPSGVNWENTFRVCTLEMGPVVFYRKTYTCWF